MSVAADPAETARRRAWSEALRFAWESPFPALLEDSAWRIVDVNPAFLAFTSFSREHLVGTDLLQLLPHEDRASQRAGRGRGAIDAVAPLVEQRLLDASGRERWFRAARHAVLGTGGEVFTLSVLQDSSAEHAARERADRSARELDDWFDLSPVGMVLFDASGLLVRTNVAFERLVGSAPVQLAEAPTSLRELLGWGAQGPLAALQAGAAPLEGQGFLAQADGTLRRVRSIVSRHRTAGGENRYMAVLEDRSVEEERDLAELQIGAMIDTASMGLATFQESSGWQRRRHGGPALGPAALQNIGRDVVLPASLPEFERLQAALRGGERVEVRYAIRHPELGTRWLFTRVEPATLASGKRTTSVVTLDVTEQQLAQQRGQELLREMATILEGTTVGIAYLRGDVLVRCNQRFEAMLGLPAGAAAGREFTELFAGDAALRQVGVAALRVLASGADVETEFEFRPAAAAGSALAPAGIWYGLAVRRTAAVAGAAETIAVLTDISRLKAQQAELESLARDSALMFSLSEVGIAFMRDGRIQRANEALARLTGWPVDELSRQDLSVLFADAPEFDARWVQESRDMRVHGRWSGERQLRRRDGSLIWVQVSKRLVVAGDPAGGIIASYVNVDARHRAERAVTVQAERTRAILDSVLVGIVTVGTQGIEWMNRSARRMFGGDLADFINQPIATAATPEPDHPFLQTHFLDDLVEGQAETFECRVKARDGREFWVVGNVVATSRESTGRQLTYALLDIERRRQAEARMSEAQSSLQRIIEAAPLAITLRDAASLRVLQINQVALATTGQALDSVVGGTPEDLFDAALAVTMRADMEQALASSEVTQREYRVDQHGELHWWDARYLPLAKAGQAPDQLLLVATDVTEQRAAQEARFEAALAQREMLVKEVHHRIKNNLQGVAGLLQQVAQRKPEVAGVITEVVAQVQAIAQVYGLQVGAAGALRLQHVVESIVTSLQRTFGQAISFERLGTPGCDWALPEAESIPIALTINELLTNAIKHRVATSGVADVTCRFEPLEGAVHIVVVNPAILPPGFSLTRVPGGVAGLGLIKALLPRRGASLRIEQQAGLVVATVTLQPPGVTRITPG
jgi:PAS domain S-box-containing protein